MVYLVVCLFVSLVVCASARRLASVAIDHQHHRFTQCIYLLTYLGMCVKYLCGHGRMWSLGPSAPEGGRGARLYKYNVLKNYRFHSAAPHNALVGVLIIHAPSYHDSN